MYAELISQLLLTNATFRIAAADVTHHAFGKVRAIRAFAAGVVLRARENLSPLVHLICHVVLGRTQKQVIGVDAWRIVATMQHEKPVGDGTLMQFPGNSMRKHYLAFAVPSLAVAMLIAPPSPQPAIASRVNLSPKSLLQRFNPPNIRTGATTIQTPAALNLIRCWMEYLAADRTGYVIGWACGVCAYAAAIFIPTLLNILRSWVECFATDRARGSIGWGFRHIQLPCNDVSLCYHIKTKCVEFTTLFRASGLKYGW